MEDIRPHPDYQGRQGQAGVLAQPGQQVEQQGDGQREQQGAHLFQPPEREGEQAAQREQEPEQRAVEQKTGQVLGEGEGEGRVVCQVHRRVKILKEQAPGQQPVGQQAQHLPQQGKGEGENPRRQVRGGERRIAGNAKLQAQAQLLPDGGNPHHKQADAADEGKPAENAVPVRVHGRDNHQGGQYQGENRGEYGDAPEQIREAVPQGRAQIVFFHKAVSSFSVS